MNKIRKGGQGFSLIELLTVLAVAAVLAGLSLPAIQGLRSTYDRKTAVDVVMSTIEQARVDALQSGANVYVIMARATDGGVSPDALIVVGDPAFGSSTTSQTLLTHWIKLPLNVRFYSSPSTLVVNASPISTTALPPLSGSPTYSGFTFNPTGTLENPASGGLEVALYEGIRSGTTETAQGSSAAATAGLSDAGIYEVVRMSRFTGRSWAEVSDLTKK